MNNIMNNINKYKIEGNIDFYSELYKSLDVSDNSIEDDLNSCLITNMPLVSNHIELTCGHKFNYIPLYNDIKNYKLKFNNLEGSVNRLSVNEIRCPYCRNKQHGLLPYYDNIGVEKIHGVNFIDPDHKNTSKCYDTCANINYCQYLTVNPYYDPNGDNPEETNITNNGNCKYFKCFMPGYYIPNNNYGDNNLYCHAHKKKVIKSHKQAILQKVKEETLKAKLEAKEQAAKAKLEAKEQALKAKLEAKEQAAKAKLEAKIKPIHNTLEHNTTMETLEYCSYILKSGPNKNNQCTHKLFNEGLCKRHYNLQNNKDNK